MYEELSPFSKFKFEDVVVPDPGLAKYIDLSSHNNPPLLRKTRKQIYGQGKRVHHRKTDKQSHAWR